jgi:hypothetical protein
MKHTIQNVRRLRQDQDKFYREYLERQKQKAEKLAKEQHERLADPGRDRAPPQSTS